MQEKSDGRTGLLDMPGDAPARQPEDTQEANASCEVFPYETEAFHRCWREHLAPKFDIPLRGEELLIHRKRLKGIIPVNELRISGWNNAWNQDLTERRLAEWEALDRSRSWPWDYFRMEWSGDRAAHQAMDRLETGNWLVCRRPAPVQYGVDLSGGVEAYLKSLSRNGRTGLKKRFRQARPLAPRLVPVSDEAGIDRFFEEFFRYHIPYWNAKVGRSYFNDIEERHFIVAWCKALHQSGNLRMDRLVMEDETANMGVSIAFGKRMYGLLTINNSSYQKYAPGKVGLYMRLQAAVDEGIRFINAGSGDYAYKAQTTNRRLHCQELIVCNPRSLKGRLCYEWFTRR